jgi:hypothetical protein
MGRRRVLLLSFFCVLVLAGCGEAKKQTAAVGEVYKRAGTASCLRSHGFTVSFESKDMNFIAYTATAGGMRAWKPKKHRKADMILAFGADGADAKQTMTAIREFARRPAIFRFRLRKANVVILWAYRPSPTNVALLDICLRQSAAPS